MAQRYANADELADMLAAVPAVTYDRATAREVVDGLISIGVPVAVLVMVDVPDTPEAG
ncbi:hypothetical protein AB0J55_17725 [Amycolatopsis sp. NPDC049688]|uniref:hypothetical protein n=1 Tax=Amycolatopsis sp. NPDC049688 TaxID=3154733 RepID=UPI00344740BA